MPAAHIQNLGGAGNGTAGQTTTVLSPSSKTVTKGNTIIVGWSGYFNITPSGVTDNLGNTYFHIECNTVGGATADIWYAPVTTGGSITTITVTHPSTQYVVIMAAEFSGVGTLSAVGAGLTSSSGTTATWVNAKTIPANGLAVGWVATWTNAEETAGAASGSPLTTIVLSGKYLDVLNNESGSLCYACAGSSAVTSFAGTTTLGSSAGWAGAGGLFNPAAAAGAKPNFIPFFWA
jgi:hypothetical protein